MRETACQACTRPCRAPVEQPKEQDLCYECQAKAAGRSTVEAHHLFGEAVNPAATAQLPGNIHREVSDMQYGWPDDVIKTAPRDPLAMAILVVLAAWDVARALAPHVRALLDFLQLLWKTLQKRYGNRWYEVLKIQIAWARLAV
jgi:hypothetical protein